ncbi:MAG: DUF1848 domain-containing protein [Planctomycetota bacterium]
MERIISVSRRTDVPAFYGDWFMNRLKDGFAGVINPFSGQKYIVSLKPEDVTCFVFWSKDFGPFIDNLKTIESLGYKFYFNYTVTGLPGIFESNLEKQSAIEALKRLSQIYSPQHINWRFDPIIISSISDRNYYLRAFEKLASRFEGVVERCYFSFVVNYGKVIRNFAEFEKSEGLKIFDWSDDFKIELANELAEIAAGCGIEMYSCCGDYLIDGRIKKAHCVDGDIIERLFYPAGLSYKSRPTRKECGCAESTDIGTYDTCPHGCVYCYANVNKKRALEATEWHEADSAFLGYSKADSDRWIAEIKNNLSNQNGGTRAGL